jgi:hypothetical protein
VAAAAGCAPPHLFVAQRFHTALLRRRLARLRGCSAGMRAEAAAVRFRDLIEKPYWSFKDPIEHP